MRTEGDAILRDKISIKLSAKRLACAINVLLIGTASAMASPIRLPSGIDFTPTVSADFLYDDNITSASAGEIESWIVIGASEFLFEANDKADTYTFKYGVEKGAYLDSSKDNYVDHDVNLGGDWELNSRQSLLIEGSYRLGHDERGSGFSRGFGKGLIEPDKFSESGLSTTFTYGSEETRISMDASLGVNNLNYSGLAKADRNRSNKYGGVALFVRLTGKTDVVAEVGHWRIGYDNQRVAQPTLDSRETDYLVGVDWKGSKSEANLRVGLRTKQFEDPGRENYSGSRWSATIKWRPVSYSTLELSSERKTEEVQRAGDFVDVLSNAVAWHHDWSDRVSSEIGYGLEKSGYRGAGTSKDEEKYRLLNLSIDYQLRRWLTMRGGHTRIVNGAYEDILRYQRNITYLGLSVSL